MSADPSEGWHTNALPHALVVTPPAFPPITGGVTGGVFEQMARPADEGGGRGRPQRRVRVLRMDRDRG